MWRETPYEQIVVLERKFVRENTDLPCICVTDRITQPHTSSTVDD